MTLTILEILYIVLIIFTSIIGTLLILVLVKVLKILGPMVEIADYYERIKGVFSLYSQIPFILKDIIKDKISGKKDKEVKK